MKRAFAALLVSALGCSTPAPPSSTSDDNKEGATGTRAKGEEGAMGSPSDKAAALKEASEFGMIGILGTGEGGGGRGEGIGSGSGFGAGHGRLGGAYQQDAPVGVRAGEWDDNASLAEFRRVLERSRSLPIEPLDISTRRELVARDSEGKPLAGCPIMISDGQGSTITLRTRSSGRALLFPRAEHLAGALTASLRCGGNSAAASIDGSVSDATVRLDGREPRDAPSATIDVAFALDTTGSMSEEIAALKSTLQAVIARAANVRVGLVEYKDRVDEFTTRVYPMSADLQRFSASIARLAASGGGDYPEAMNVGLHDAITKLEWNDAASARLLFVIGDAPPHAHDQGTSYADSARLAAHAGIQVFSIAASGMDEFGQIVFRQIAQYTGGTEIFVLRGGAGPASTGGGDPIKSTGGTQTQYRSGNLDALVLEKIDRARKALDTDPLTNP
jgi:Mg-chelatase subunit ChlD